MAASVLYTRTSVRLGFSTMSEWDGDPNRCREDNGEILWDEDRGGYLCDICGKAKCHICSRNLAIDEDIYCDRCEDEGDMIALGNE